MSGRGWLAVHAPEPPVGTLVTDGEGQYWFREENWSALRWRQVDEEGDAIGSRIVWETVLGEYGPVYITPSTGSDGGEGWCPVAAG